MVKKIKKCFSRINKYALLWIWFFTIAVIALYSYCLLYIFDRPTNIQIPFFIIYFCVILFTFILSIITLLWYCYKDYDYTLPMYNDKSSIYKEHRIYSDFFY